MKKLPIIFILTAVAFIPSCKQDFINPNASTEAQVFSSPTGLTGVAVSLQRVYSVSRLSPVYNTITASGALTNEFRLLNTGNTDEAQLFTGGVTVDNLNSIVNSLWAQNNKIIYDADKVLAGANALGDKNYASGLIAYTSIFKALAIGALSNFYEQIPAGPGTTSTPATFQSRLDGYKRAIQVLNNAQAAVAANAISAAFLSNIPSGIDIPNTLNALKARFSLFAGDYAGALSAANAVSLTVKSEFRYESANLNPIFETVTGTNNVYQPLDSTLGLPVGLQPDPNDKRVPFYTAINPSVAPRFRVNSFFITPTAPIPVYLPGEMTLIKAEAYARQATPDLTNAKAELDKILTKTPAGDPFGVAAQLPAYSGAVTQATLLTEIYRNRCIELYMSGLKLEDMRRFGRPTTERKRNYLPYPFRERDNNSNTPPDPSF